MVKAKTLEVLRPPEDGSSEAEIGRAEVYGVSDTGLVRQSNEDQFLVAHLERTLKIAQCGIPENDGRVMTDTPSAMLLLVADGMGGHEHGELASAVVTDVMVKYAFQLMPWLGTGAREDLEGALVEGLQRAVQQSQERIEEVAERKSLAPQLGTTLTLAYVAWPTVFLVHVGDSRAYLYRDERLLRLTRDHTFAQHLVQEGVMSPEEAEMSELRSVLVNAVGGGTETAPQVEALRVELARGDLLMLCTDGLFGDVPDEALANTLSAVTRKELVAPGARRLVEAAKKAGGYDNITVILARF